MTNTQTSFSAEKHEYQFTEGGLTHKAPNGRETTLSWNDLHGFKRPLFGTEVYLTSLRARMPISPLKGEVQKEFLLNLFARWRKQAPDVAKKAAFDYIDTQKSFTTIFLVVCTFFALPVAYVQYSDSIGQYICSQNLKRSPVMGEMRVTKMTRKSDGPYLLSLEFQTPEGRVIKGKDQFISADKEAPPTNMPIVYFKDDPSCWSLTPSVGSREVNWAKRRFFEAYTFLFATFFLLFGVIGIFWSLKRRSEKRPYAKEIAEAFSLQ